MTLTCTLRETIIKAMMMTRYENLTFDQERALYALKTKTISNCNFQGEADGESPLKECRNIKVKNCLFDLRYPLWHLKNGLIENCSFTQNSRAALWYDRKVKLIDCTLSGIKALRECVDSEISNSFINSLEFAWFCKKLTLDNVRLDSEYPFLRSEHMNISRLTMNAKYSFQYVKNTRLKKSILNTKDAFWHARDAVIEDCVISGEYLGWYSKNLKFINCKIIGTQPLCYAQNLVLENCEMIDTDLAFEYSDVRAKIKGSLTSVKNPESGRIQADHIDAIIIDSYHHKNSSCQIIENEKVSS